MEKIPRRYFTGKRLEIIRTLIEEVQDWKSTKKITNEEFMRLVDRLFKIK